MSIAIVSTACRFPDAASPSELWTNLVEGRRSFREIPAQRLEIARYAIEAIGEADSITPIRAGLLTNWRFPRSAFRIPEKTFAATDLTHWLALELAAEAMAQIGGLERLDRSRTAVVVANTLTGEFSRATLLRLRLPFLADILTTAGDAEGLPPHALTRLQQRFAAALRERFTDPNEDSLAGGLASTIAGRIANHFDLRGGAYSVDGACASSLVALADAANLLMADQVDAVVVAAVDLSLDPFELVGFSRNGALAAEEMRVFDARAAGFWPGEGGACAILMREKEARQHDLSILAKIRGWGLSTDGAGGLTRPSSEGQLSAARRAYAMASVDPADLAFVEAHGTGTAVGDPIEVHALATLCSGAHTPLPIGSIKANIGHTKAAAGFAGLVKSVEALRHGFLPPHVGCTRPHPVFAELDGVIYPALRGQALAEERCAIAGVSSFGFGGINAHVVLEKATSASRFPPVTRRPSPQDAELFLFSGNDSAEIDGAIAALLDRAPTLSMAELIDAAAHVAASLRDSPMRLAIVASSGSELADRLASARLILQGDQSPHDGVSFGCVTARPRIGFLFPGQAAPCRPDGGLWRHRFPDLADLLALMPKPAGSLTATDIAQPAIVAASLAALRVLERLGVTADIGVGHSLGEISALAWAGALDGHAAIELARNRGQIMAGHGAPGGAMLRVGLSADNAELLLRDCGLVIACHNGPTETVLAGTAAAVGKAADRCAANKIDAVQLPVSHAFHSPHMRDAAQPLKRALEAFSFGPLTRTVVSTVSGRRLEGDNDLRRLLIDQLETPVQFEVALSELAANTDLAIEVGPGHGLSRLAHERGLTAMSVDAFCDSIVPLLTCASKLFVSGVNIRVDALFADRPIRRFNPAAIPAMIENPCGRRDEARTAALSPPLTVDNSEIATPQTDEPLPVVTFAVTRETGLDAASFSADDRFLDQLHLNSLAVSRIVREAAKALNVRVPSVPTEFANATSRQLAEALNELRTCEGAAATWRQRIAGVRRWVRPYAMSWEASPMPPQAAKPPRWSELTIGPHGRLDCELGKGGGLLIWIDDPFAAEAAALLLALAADAARSGVAHLALCHSGLPVAAFARSVAQEGHFQSVRVIDRADAGKHDLRIAAVLAVESGPYVEVRLSEQEGTEAPVFAPATPSSLATAAITAEDVVVVIGGGKGIAAECALRLAERRATVILVGRSAADDPEVAATLERARLKALPCRYISADVLDPGFAERLRPTMADVGPASVLVYAAGANDPKQLTELDDRTIQAALVLKTTGFGAALDALGPQLRHLITFGSIIGRVGLEGEAHYALANSLQTAATEAWGTGAPGRSALAIEWSLWGGVGMGERLGTIERLEAKGVDALSVDQALDAFEQLIAANAIGSVVVTSRFGPPPFLGLGAHEFPLLRFVDEPRLHFPNVEIIVETGLSLGRDPYLADHIIAGKCVLPGVIGLEAMAQVASVVMPLQDRIGIGEVSFTRAVEVSESGLRIRIAAVRTGEVTTEAALYAEDDDFAEPCMRALFVNTEKSPAPVQAAPSGKAFASAPLYGPLFFGGDRFRRLGRFESATSRRVSARLCRPGKARWFGPYEPQDCLLWDPGAADAALHALQVAVPHKRVLPVAVERIDVDRRAEASVRLCAIERRGSADCYVFDIALTDARGRVTCRWSNAAFRTAAHIDIGAVLAAAPRLARPYLERMAREVLLDDTIEIAVIEEPAASREARRRAALQELGVSGSLERRGDGRPIRTDGRGTISIAHGRDVTLATTADAPIGCDLEPLRAPPADPDETCRHVAAEACRKLGRRPAMIALRATKRGAGTMIEDIDLVVVDLATTSGRHAVAFGRARDSVASFVLPVIREAIP